MSGKLFGKSIVVACAVASSGCSVFGGYYSSKVSGSGVPASEVRRISGEFSKIKDSGPANLDVEVGPTSSVRVQGDDNIVPHVKTVIEDGTLVIKSLTAIAPRSRLLVTVTVPSLEAVSLDGAGNVNVNGIDEANFDVSLAGAGNIQLSGTTRSLSASLDGAGNLRLASLKAKDATVSVDGVGKAELWATQTLDASINGVGNIKYKGAPQVTRSINGVGKIEPA